MTEHDPLQEHAATEAEERTEAIEVETTDRGDEIAQERTDRTEAIAVERADRVDAMTAESTHRDEAIVGLRDAAALQNRNIGRLADQVELLAVALSTRPTRRETVGLVGKIAVGLAVLTLLIVGAMFNRIIEDGEDRARTIEAIADNQEALDGLVAFVADLRAEEPNPALAQALQDIADLKAIACLDHPEAEVCAPG